MKKFLALILSLAMVFALVACGGEKTDDNQNNDGDTSSPVSITLATGGTSGTYYAFSGVVANTLNGKLEGVSINVESSGASGANIDMIDTGNDQLAIVQNDVMYYAYSATDMYADKDPIQSYSAVMSCYPMYVQIVANKNITSIEDLKGKTVAVVGGGNVAMDAARCSKRLGAEVYVVYRRGMEELPARHEEVEHAIEEGVIFKTLNNPVQINGDEQDCVKSMTCIEMELGEPDASGRRRPVEKKGSEFDLPVDAVIMSLGTSPNPLIKSTTKGLEVNRKGGIIVNEEGLTSRQAVYAGGDAVTGAATVILAMGAGKLGAKSIDEYLSAK